MYNVGLLMFLLQASVLVQEEWWFKFFLYPSFRVTFLSNSKKYSNNMKSQEVRGTDKETCKETEKWNKNSGGEQTKHLV